MTSLASILESSYQPNRQAKDTLEKEGYKLDTDLSTREHKVFLTYVQLQFLNRKTNLVAVLGLKQPSNHSLE